MFRLFTLSANTPPKRDSIIMGRKEQAVTVPNKEMCIRDRVRREQAA